VHPDAGKVQPSAQITSQEPGGKLVGTGAVGNAYQRPLRRAVRGRQHCDRGRAMGQRRHWGGVGIIERYMPSVVPAMRAARQQHGEVSFRALNEVEVPVALISMLLLPVILLLGRGDYGDLRLLAATVAVALLANAVVCGALSNPHDRYGARLAWIATFAVVLVPHRRPPTPLQGSTLMVGSACGLCRCVF
jgi:hypothetical protein